MLSNKPPACTKVRTVPVLLIVAALAGTTILGPSVQAQAPGSGPAQTRPAEPAKPAGGKEVEPKVRVPTSQNVNLTGRLVDLHSFMTDTYPNPDRAKTTADMIKAGVPAGLDTAAGLIVLGTGTKSPADRLPPLAYQEVEIKGKLYYRRGARYLDVTSIAKAKAVDGRGTPARPPTIGVVPATKPAAP
jgi:hypothetical protein